MMFMVLAQTDSLSENVPLFGKYSNNTIVPY